MGQRAVWCLCLTLLCARTAWAQKDRYEPGEELPPFTLKALNGDVLGDTYISIDRYFGASAKEPKKGVLLSFFASYCEPCRKEMPLLVALQEAYKEKGLQIVLVSIDTETEKVDIAKALAKEHGAKFPVLSDRFNIVAKRFFVNKLPNSYLANGEGKVVMANVGYNDDISKRLVDQIRKTLGEPTSEPIPEAIVKHLGQSAGAPEVVTVKSDGAATDPAAGVQAAPPTPPPADTIAADTKGKGKAKAKAKSKANKVKPKGKRGKKGS